MSQPSRILIYGLLDPGNDELFYVGQTRKRREFRLLEHIEDAVAGSDLPVHDYVRDVMASGRIPAIFVIEKVGDPNRADELEIRWIEHFASRPEDSLPIRILPQTSKSTEVSVATIDLKNVRHMPSAPEQCA